MGEVMSLTRVLEPFTPGWDAAPWANALRETALAEFNALGLPNRRVEAWRYSNLAQALNEKKRPAGPARAAPALAEAYVVAFENGRLTGALAPSPPGVSVLSLAEVLVDPASPFAAMLGQAAAKAEHAVISLNASHLQEGVVIHVQKGARAPAPFHLSCTWSDAAGAGPQSGHVRVLIVLEEGAEATVFESHTGAPAFASLVTDATLAAGSRLNHVRLELLGASARQAATTRATLAQAARYQAFYLSEGAHFARHEALIDLAGEEAEAVIDGAYLVTGARHCDNTTVIAHSAPHTNSRQAFRGVLGGKARGVYQGCVKVSREAQKTDARQMSRALLLSHGAEAVTKPELEIFADDVKCSHGATAGELDAAALFFLRSRGIPEAQARTMLIEAFLAEALATIADTALAAPAIAAVQDWLTAHAGDVSHAQ
jgi:Fe-S cluster assembly protein SufD